ncbi:hypothetical protein glysoja_008225 [Glycine soja]|nr:hypothetical protein glysoja_008225 [Glycine soja]
MNRCRGPLIYIYLTVGGLAEFVGNFLCNGPLFCVRLV